MTKNHTKLLSLFLLSIIFNLKAQVPYLIKDLNISTEIVGGGLGINPLDLGASMEELDGILYYSYSDNVHGSELWRTDGTMQGTYMIKDIAKNGSSSPTQFVKIDNTLLFTTRIGELWKTDGTKEGTVLVKGGFQLSGSGLPFKNFGEETVTNNTVYFAATSNDGKYGLWKSDGTEDGTILIKEGINISKSNSSDIKSLIINNVLFFKVHDDIHGEELWKSDGTKEGTSLVKDIRSGSSSSSLDQFTKVNNTLYFSANDGVHGKELWKSDGTEEGTVLVKDLDEGHNSSVPTHLISFKNALYFTFNHNLWKSDGTAEGTILISETPFINSVSIFSANNNNLYMTSGFELWKSNGTEEGTNLVRNFANENIKISALINARNTVYLRLEGIEPPPSINEIRELWKTDGTDQGTVLVKNINPKLHRTTKLLDELSKAVEINDILYFLGYSVEVEDRSIRLWKSDGTTQGTTIIEPTGNFETATSSSSLGSFTTSNGKMFFIANNGLWTTDATEKNTRLVKQFSLIYNITHSNNILYFIANDGIHGEELWKSNGTEAGTTMVKDINLGRDASILFSNIIIKNNSLFFKANDGIHGEELWKSDGNEAGTTMVKDINPEISVSGNLSTLVHVNDIFYFTGDDGIHGNELWKSDGTETGTTMVKDISLGESSSVLADFIAVGDLIFFQKDLDELWRSDGTETGTFLIKKLDKNIRINRFRQNNISFNNTLYTTSTRLDPLLSSELLWKSDGTETGTVIIKTFNSEHSIIGFDVVGNSLFIRMSNSTHGDELWKTDGTEAGTVMVKDINPGPEDSSPQGFLLIGDTIYFSANDGIHGRELWKTDGTELGTVLAADIAIGNIDSSPLLGKTQSGTTYLSGAPRSKSDFNYGMELMALGHCSPDNIKFNNVHPIENMMYASETKSNSTTETCHCNIFNELLNITEATGTNPIQDITTNKIYITTTNTSEYVKRHYEITPQNNIETTTGTLTLFFTQEEFNAFNTLQTQLLPTSPTDIANIANIRIVNRKGNSSDGSGNVNSYPDDIALINPEDDAIVWNAQDNLWEVRFNTDSFGGFWLTSALRTETLTINEVTSNSITLSPNPTQSHIQFSGLKTPENFTIYNMLGVPLLKGIVTNAYPIININNLPSGLYIVELRNKTLSIKIAKN